MLKAFLDDSESFKKPGFFVLAGYIAPAEQWAKLTDEWQTVLDGPPHLDYFKLKEAIRDTPNGQFHGLTREECNSRIARFRGLVEKYVSAECAVYFRLDYFRQGYAANMPFKSKALRNPFCFAWLRLTTTIAKNLPKMGLPRERIDFVIDDRVKEQDLVYAGFKGAQELQKRMGFPSLIDDVMPFRPQFASDTEVLPLQAADMMATMCRLSLEAGIAGTKPKVIPGFTKKLSSCVQSWNLKQFATRAAKDRGFIRAREMVKYHIP
jgi:hypothetical protein